MDKYILLVDDELNVVKSISRTLHRGGYKISTAISGTEALEYLESHKVDLIISDMRMPEMDGYELLEIVREKYPSVIRLILSGYTDKNLILKTIVNGIAKCYITKPWENEDLRQHIKHLFKTKEILNGTWILKFINDLDYLPQLPEAYKTCMQMIANDESIEKISRYIEKLPDVTAEILKVVNSSFYGISVGSVKNAIVYIGLDALKNIILGASVFNSLNKGQGDRTISSLIWEQSKICNRAIHLVYKEIYEKDIPDEISCAGILHNIGMLIMNNKFNFYVLTDLNSFDSFIKTENKVTGIDNAQLSAYILDWWNLPASLIETTLYQYTPLNNDIYNKDFLELFYICSAIAWNKVTKKPDFFPIDPDLISKYNDANNIIKLLNESI